MFNEEPERLAEGIYSKCRGKEEEGGHTHWPPAYMCTTHLLLQDLHTQQHIRKPTNPTNLKSYNLQTPTNLQPTNPYTPTLPTLQTYYCAVRSRFAIVKILCVAMLLDFNVFESLLKKGKVLNFPATYLNFGLGAKPKINI